MRGKMGALVLLIVSTGIALLCAELIIRVWFPARAAVVRLHLFEEEEQGKFARYDPTLGWDGRASVDDAFEWMDCRHHVRQNSYGYRSVEHDRLRKKGRRFVVLGDSFTWGFGVENDELFTSRIEANAQRRVEMVNMGVSGFGTDQEYLLWTLKGRQWTPDDVLLMVFLPTDFWDNLSAERYQYPKPLFRFDTEGGLALANVPVPQRDRAWGGERRMIGKGGGTWIHTLLDHSALAGLLLNAATRSEGIRGYLELRGIIPERGPGYDHEYPLYYLDPDQQTAYAWDMLFALIGKLNDDVRKNGAVLTVVVIPSIVQVYPELWEALIRRTGHRFTSMVHPDAPSVQITRRCKVEGIRVIDLLPGLREAGKTNPHLYYPVNLHWTAGGHGVAANILLKELHVND